MTTPYNTVTAGVDTGTTSGGGGLQPFQFQPETYGASRNGILLVDAVMTSGSPILTSASAPFKPQDVGKHVYVSTSVSAFVGKHYTITAYNGPTSVTLNANSPANTTGTPGAFAWYGSDDTPAWNTALSKAVAYASSSTLGYGEITTTAGMYIAAGAFQLGGGGLGNAQILWPIVAPSGRLIVLSVRCQQDVPATGLMHWQQLNPQPSGCVVASVRDDGTNDGTFGPAWVFGGPFNGYGGEPGTYSNCMIQMLGITVLCPYNPTMGGISTFGMIQADVDVACMTAAVVPNTGSLPTLANPNNISNQYTYGLQMPSAGNQTQCRIRRYVCEGFCYGIGLSEWSHLQQGHCLYCIGAIGLYSGNGVSMVHAAQVDFMEAENCTNAIIQVDPGIKRIYGTIQTESISATGHVFDPSNLIYGTVTFLPQNANGTSNNFANSHGLNLRMLNGMTTPQTLTPPAVPASNTPVTNYFGVTVKVTITSGGAAVTAITLATPTGTSRITGLTLGTSGSVILDVPPAWAISWTGAGAAPTWTWDAP